MQDQTPGRLIKRALYEEYERESGGLCLDPKDPAFLGTLILVGLLMLPVLALFRGNPPAVIYPPQPTIINNN